MKTLAAALILCCLLSCKKQSMEWITATVIQKGCYPGSWIVQLDNPDRSKEPFLCDRGQASLPSTYPNCGNAAVIINLPSSLSQPGTKIKFSKWEDKGLLCFSSTLAPHHLEVIDASAK